VPFKGETTFTTKTKYRPMLTEWCLNGCVFFFDCLCAERERERRAQKRADKKAKVTTQEEVKSAR
jgi:hypothetical protein